MANSVRRNARAVLTVEGVLYLWGGCAGNDTSRRRIATGLWYGRFT